MSCPSVASRPLAGGRPFDRYAGLGAPEADPAGAWLTGVAQSAGPAWPRLNPAADQQRIVTFLHICSLPTAVPLGVLCNIVTCQATEPIPSTRDVYGVLKPRA